MKWSTCKSPIMSSSLYHMNKWCRFESQPSNLQIEFRKRKWFAPLYSLMTMIRDVFLAPWQPSTTVRQIVTPITHPPETFSSHMIYVVFLLYSYFFFLLKKSCILQLTCMSGTSSAWWCLHVHVPVRRFHCSTMLLTLVDKIQQCQMLRCRWRHHWRQLIEQPSRGYRLAVRPHGYQH